MTVVSVFNFLSLFHCGNHFGKIQVSFDAVPNQRNKCNCFDVYALILLNKINETNAIYYKSTLLNIHF